METSAIQAAKLVIVQATGLSKDALHIHVGLAVYLLAWGLSWPRHFRALGPLLIVVLMACLGEVLDLRDDFLSLGHGRWGASLHDVINTSFWPCVLHALTRWRASPRLDA